MDMAKEYDLVIIGAGPGGYTAALKAAEYGIRTLVIEEKKLGGNCVNRGCIPTKALLHASSRFREMQQCDEFGVSADFISFDFKKMQQYKKRAVKTYRDEIERLFCNAGVDYVEGKAVLRRDKTVEVRSLEGRDYYRGENIIIATGASAEILPIPGAELSGVFTSSRLLAADIWNFDRLTIIGGGVIGVEFATIFNALCSKVTIIEKGPHLLGPMDEVVAKALEKKIKFYTSPDLKSWTWTSDFGPAGDSEKSWECPDLFQLPVDGDSDKKRWVMVVSVNWAQEQYFIGDFDGTSFKLMENHPAEPLYVDKGLDFYASRTFQDFDGTLDSKISMGWIATWDYAPVAPSKYGKGFWSIPRNLELKTYKEGVRLVQKPVEQLQTLRHKPASVKRALSVGTQRLPGFVPDENVYELDASFSTDVSNTFGLNLCVGEGRKVVVSYDTDSHNLVIDRTHCSDVQIPKFSRMAYARVEPVDNKIRLHIFVDKSSIEIFANDGKDVFTLLTYPGEAQTGIELFAQKKGTKMELDAWMLKSIWR